MSDEQDSAAQGPKAAKQAAAEEPKVSAKEDVHSRATVPAPAPERLDPTPVTLRLDPTPVTLRLDPRVSESGPVKVLAQRVEPLAVVAAVSEERISTEPLLQNEIETWRPPAPPPLPKYSQPVPAGTVSASSSIAPRDLPQREEQPQPRLITKLASVALIALLGSVGIWFMSGGQQEGAPSRLSPQPIPATATAPAPVQAPVPVPAPSETAQPAIAEPAPAPANDPAMVAKAPTAPVPAAHAKPTLAPVRTKPAPAAVQGDLPEQPSRQTIADTLSGMRSELAQCAGGKPGVAELDLTLTGTGAVSNAVVGGDFAGSPEGSCIARTLRRARFAPFQQPKFRVLYRLML